MSTPVDFLIAADLHFQPNPSAVSAALIPQAAYINQIVDAFLLEVLDKKPRALILLGDLANNGRPDEHAEMARRLKAVTAAGIRVLVLPGNHDVTAETAPHFADVYADCGYGQATCRDRHSLSYALDMGDMWWLMLDTTRAGDPTAVVNGAVAGDTIEWMEGILVSAAEARKPVIVAGHHNLLAPAPGLYGQVDAQARLMRLFKRHGVHLYMSGHRHLHSITRTADGFTEIGECMLAAYPNTYGALSMDAAAGKAHYHLVKLDMEGWARKTGAADGNLVGFDAFSLASGQALRAKMASHCARLLRPQNPEPLTQFLTSVFVCFDDGTLAARKSQLRKMPGYADFKELTALKDPPRHIRTYALIFAHAGGAKQRATIALRGGDA